ncbi:hypothetical protein [Streptomyces sp. NPDC048710]|uniref:hypothetical protein n=1 Tax=unclassified Streptomyces TaxID=2593676 RepID=UPI00371DC9EB
MPVSDPLPRSICLATAVTGTLGPYAWWLALVPLAALVYAAHRTARAIQRQRLEPAENEVGELLKALDAFADRAVTDHDLSMLRTRRHTFQRLATLHRKIPELLALNDAFPPVWAIEPPRDRRDQARYQQQLGEAIGSLRAAAETAFTEVHRRRNR